jgi:hypothetical protein
VKTGDELEGLADQFNDMAGRLQESYADLEKGMRVTRVVKDVTWNTLNEPGFIDWLKEQFPLRKDLQQPFELYHAAREALKSKPRQA